MGGWGVTLHGLLVRGTEPRVCVCVCVCVCVRHAPVGHCAHPRTQTDADHVCSSGSSAVCLIRTVWFGLCLFFFSKQAFV